MRNVSTLQRTLFVTTIVLAVFLFSFAPPALAGSGDAHITVVQTTDLHHHANGSDHVGLDVNPWTGTGATGAYSRVASYVNYVRLTAGHPVVLVDSGDWTMGTIYDLTLGSRPLALGFLQLMHYNCVTLGNHEFDYTPKGLAQMLSAAQSSFGFNTPIVASNLNLNGNTDLAPFVGSGKLIQTARIETLLNGIKVGYIGLMGKDAARVAASAPVTFTDLSGDYAAIQALVTDLRQNQGVQVVIALSHSGTNAAGTAGEDVELANHVIGIDVIASGHTHTPLNAYHTVTNTGWSTQIIDAGAYGTNVSRIDLTYHSSTGSTTVDSFINLPMTNAALTAVSPWLGPDPLQTLIVRATDQQLNGSLGPFFSKAFTDYDPNRISTGIYHPVGTTSQLMVANDISGLVPAPNGMGDLVADAFRTVPNGIIAQTLAAVGGNPANLPTYDFTPVQAAVMPSGFIRGKLLDGVALSFADVYNVLPLGFSPDPTQALPVGYPLVSGYLELADLKTVCALQLLVQSNLADPEFYLNLSGLQYSLDPVGSYVYFKYATAAGVLQVTSQKASGGSISALQALSAVSNLASDNGASLLADAAGGNPYAVAMVNLNDSSPSGTNLGVLGQVAAAAAADGANGTNSLGALIVSKAIAAINTVSGFAPSDGANLGAATPLSGATRTRFVADLSAFLLLGTIQSQFGTTVTAYASATGPATLSGADIPGLLANRVDAAPGSAGVQELKEWMALLSYLDTSLDGTVTSQYASSLNFLQFPSFGAAVETRNASYPLPSIGQMVGTLASLQTAP